MDRLPTILIVEDYEYHLRLISDILKRNGYTVIGATDIDEALDLIHTFQDEIDTADEAQDRLIAIIDVAIPQSSNSLVLKRGGITLLEELRQDYPEIPAILLSVYGEADDVKDIGKRYNVPIVTKPLGTKQLLRTIQNISPS